MQQVADEAGYVASLPFSPKCDDVILIRPCFGVIMAHQYGYPAHGKGTVFSSNSVLICATKAEMSSDVITPLYKNCFKPFNPPKNRDKDLSTALLITEKSKNFSYAKHWVSNFKISNVFMGTQDSFNDYNQWKCLSPCVHESFCFSTKNVIIIILTVPNTRLVSNQGFQ